VSVVVFDDGAVAAGKGFVVGGVFGVSSLPEDVLDAVGGVEDEGEQAAGERLLCESRAQATILRLDKLRPRG